MKTRILLGCLLGAIHLAASVCQGQESPDSMVVVLSNFGVIQGQITPTDDGLIVQTTSGSKVVLRFDQITCLSESLDEAFTQLLNSNEPDDAAGRRRLFDWCLTNGLVERAEALVAFAESSKVDPAELQMMRRRIDGFEIEARRATNQTWPSNVEHVRETSRAHQKDIEQLIDSLPSGTEAVFNQQLHSKLVIGCTAAKCHSRESESLAIWHHGKGIAVPRGLTRHNLHQVMQFINRDDPSASKILEMALNAHGGQSKPTYRIGDSSFQLLRQWTYAVSRHPENYWTDIVQGTKSPQPSTALASASASEAAGDGVISQVGFVESLVTPTIPPQTDQRPSATVEQPPSDLCDPILFNRQHHPQRGH